MKELLAGSLILVGIAISSSLIKSIKNREEGGGRGGCYLTLNGQNLLSMTKVTCRWSLILELEAACTSLSI